MVSEHLLFYVYCWIDPGTHYISRGETYVDHELLFHLHGSCPDGLVQGLFRLQEARGMLLTPAHSIKVVVVVVKLTVHLVTPRPRRKVAVRPWIRPICKRAAVTRARVRRRMLLLLLGRGLPKGRIRLCALDAFGCCFCVVLSGNFNCSGLVLSLKLWG